MILRRKFSVPKFAVLARSKQLTLMPSVTVKFRLDLLVCGLQSHLLWHLAKVGPMFPSKEAMNTCRDWAFSNSGLNVMHCRKDICGYLWDMLVSFRNPFPLVFLAKTLNSWRDQRVSKGDYLWISDRFEWFFVVNFLHPKFGVLARSKQLTLMPPVTVKFRLDLLVCGLQSHLLRHLTEVGPMFPRNKSHKAIQSHKAMKNCRDWAFSNSGLEVWLPAFQLPMLTKCDALPKSDFCDMFV